MKLYFCILSWFFFSYSFCYEDRSKYIENMFSCPIDKRRIDFIDSIGSIFKNCYVNLKLKESVYNFNWVDEVSLIKSKIEEIPNMDIGDFHEEVFRLLSKLRDPHCSVVSNFPNKYSSLPFSLLWIGNEVFVGHVDPAYSTSFRPGQRVLLIDGMDPNLIAKRKLENVFGKDNKKPNWAKRYVASLLTNSGPRYLTKVRSGTSVVKFDGFDGASPYIVSVPWLIFSDTFSSPTSLHEPMDCSIVRSSQNLYREVPPVLTIRVEDKRDLSSNRFEKSGSLSNYYPGCPASFLPHLGNLMWHSRSNIKCDLDASLYDCGDIKVGYLRIGVFSEWKFQELDRYLDYFNSQVDVLVLDLMCNTGGYGGRALGLASRFANETIFSHEEVIRVSPSLCELGKEIENYISSIHYSPGNTEELFDIESFGLIKSDDNLVSAVRSFCSQISDAISNGKTYMYPSYWLGIDKIEAVPIFTKPIVILTDDYTMSSAESFLEILQNNRSKINFITLGDVTAGVASGTDVVHIPNNDGISGFSYSWTAILSSRDGLPIEDRGILPDEFYVITPDDIKSGFLPFKEKILNTCKMALRRFS